MPSVKGTSSVADLRARRKALKGTRFPKNFSSALELGKINKEVLSQWIEHKITSILGFDDEIVSSTAVNLFLPEEGKSPDPKRAQLDLVGFLGDEQSASFAKELWTLMLEAQDSSTGIPRTLLEKKKQELAKQAQPPRPPPQVPHGANRNPEMNRFVEEASRRAQAAREMVRPPPAAAAGMARAREHNPVPVSPTHPSQPKRQSTGMPPGLPHARGRSFDRSGSYSDDRKMAPRHRRPDNSYNNRPTRRHDDDARGGPPLQPPPPQYGRQPSRSFSPDRDRIRWGGREHDPRRREDWRRNDRPRYYDEEDEFQQLERRLAMLQREYSKRPNNYSLDEEIEDIKDRLYHLERRRRRHRRDREEDEYRRRAPRRPSPRRSRSPPRRRSRSHSESSEESRGRRRSRSPSSESDSSHSSDSPSSRSRSNGGRSSSSEVEDRGRRRAERRYSSDSHSSRGASDYGSR